MRKNYSGTRITTNFFLSRYAKYISPIADTYCYCLLPNHFHFLIRIKEYKEIEKHFLELKPLKSFSPELVPEFIMQCFSNLLNSYTKAFNKMYDRKGGLFIDYMRRVEIKTDSQFGATVFYIHKNPVHHGYCEKPDQWSWSSYTTMLSGKPTKLLREEVLNWFGGSKGFIDYHSQPIYLKEDDIE
ncbi:MAG: transposase [Chitinophagaceae bacterium]